jgi:hypothetical protein
MLHTEYGVPRQKKRIAAVGASESHAATLLAAVH